MTTGINIEDDDGEIYEEAGGYYIDDIYIPPPPPPPKYHGDETGTRLQITFIENINFKSYAGVQKLGPFHKSFTSIVGPNGSGKSNVIDSMLFVFGFRATKLRLKKLSYLIHKSDQYPDFDFCKVIVHFALIDDAEGDEFRIVEGSQFQVSRTVHRNNSSYYQIGDKTVQFKEVSQLLQSHGIDLRYNRFLILQGEVEQIALMKPKAENEHDTGMLEFLEEIIGSNRLKAPLDQLQIKVEQKNDLRAEKLNRVRTVQKEKDNLEKAKDEAVAFLETENNLTLVKSKYYQLCKAEAASGKEEANKEFERANKIYQEIIDKSDEIKKQKKEMEENISKIQAEYNALNKKAEEFNEAFKEIERKDVQLRDKIKHNKAKGKKLVADLEKENQILEELQQMPEKYNADIEKMEKTRIELESEKKDAEEKLSIVMEEIKFDTKAIQEEKDKHEKQLLSLQIEVNESHSKSELARSELDLYLSKERGEKAKLEQIQLKYDRSVEDLKQKISALTEYKRRKPEVEQELNRFEKAIEDVVQERNKVNEDLRKNLEKLEDIKASFHSVDTKNKVLSALMEQKRLGNINGLYGRLGDLGAIDKKYDIAISTACGPLDNLVTDTMENAIKCSNFLKTNNIGAATFIALDKMRRFESVCRQQINTPENVPRLFDLIRVKDEDVLPAFYYAIRDTLVAEDLTQATRIGLKGLQRWRVVTLKGELVEVSGAMSGGGRPSRGRMGSSVTTCEVDSQEIKDLEDVVRKLEMKLSELRVKGESLNNDCERAKSDLEMMKKNQPKYELDVKSAEGSQKELEKQIVAQRKVVESVVPDEKKVKELEANVAALSKVYNEVANKAKKIEDKVEEANKKIKSIMDERVGTAKKKVESLKSQVTDIVASITKTSVALKTNDRNIKKCEKKVESTEKEIEECQALIESSKSEMKELEKHGQEIALNYQEATTKRDEYEEKVKQVQAEMSKIKSKENKMNSENLDAKHELDIQEGILKEKEAKYNHWQNKIQELELHEIDGKPNSGPIPQLTEEELETLNPNSVQNEIDSIEKALKSMKPNMAAIAEYKKKEKIWLERVEELKKITEERDKCKDQYEKLKAQRFKEFKDGFLIITRKLKEMYRTITLGGDAELESSDSLDPFSEGINFAVRPNKKSWKRISNLSGGEKTLASLALIFALHYYKPSPLYVMDEIDAALDFKNVSIIANYIKQRTRNTQFIIISLRYNMYELADRLVGIYKTYNCTKSATFNPEYCIKSNES